MLLSASLGFAQSEAAPDAARDCFPGAGYRKAVSSQDLWTGIETVVTLPTPFYDPARVNEKGRILDSASVYVGGHAGEQEVDCGLSWEVVREADGRISSRAKAFRPFWRARAWHSGPTTPDFYFSPGDTVYLACRTAPEPDKLVLEIRLLRRSAEPTTGTEHATGRPVWTGPDRVEAAEAQDDEWTDSELAAAVADPLTSFSVTFDAEGFGTGNVQEFKSVNGLYQSGNEGRDAVPTRTAITGCVWRQVFLLRRADGREAHVPMTPDRFTDMRCPAPSNVAVAAFGETGERVDLFGIASAPDSAHELDPPGSSDPSDDVISSEPRRPF